MKTQLVTILALLGLTGALDLKPLLDVCVNQQTPTRQLSDKILLPPIYKVSGSLTDWFLAQTWLIQETATKDSRVFERQSKDIREMWIQDLTDKHVTFVNTSKTVGDCDGDATLPEILNVARFKSIIGSDVTSINSIVSGLTTFATKTNGFILEKKFDVVGGVNPLTWIACIDGKATNQTSVIVEVKYGGDDTVPPAISGFSNPVLISFRIAEVDNFNSTLAKNHWAVELDRYENPVGNEGSVQHGVFCKSKAAATLQLKPLDEYAATLSYVDYRENTTEVVDLLYSKSRQVFIVSGSSFRHILSPDGDRFTNVTDYVLHDFKYGYEVTMSKEACQTFGALQPGTNDVVIDNSTFITMLPMVHILVDNNWQWVHQPNETDMAGNQFLTYRYYDAALNLNNELHVTGDLEIHSMNTYLPGTRQLIKTMTVTRIPIEASRLNLKSAQLSDCYDSAHYPNNTWIFPIKDKSLTDLSKVGLNRLNEAVVNSINKVQAVIPYRVVVFYVENQNSGLSMILRLAEKSNIKPANVTGYNYTTELPTVELFKLISNAMMNEKMPIEVETVGGVKEEWIADAKSMKMFPDGENGFLGYTGGAMFVLAIFCLLIGVSIGAVGVFVVTRRQRISTLAYQVFE